MTSLTYTAVRNYAPDRLGPELVTNPGPFTTTTGWTAQNSATLSVFNGKLRVARNAVNDPAATQVISVVAGDTYLLDTSLFKGTASGYCSIGVHDGVRWMIWKGHTADKVIRQRIYPKSATLTIWVHALTSVGTTYSDFGLISLKRVVASSHGPLTINPFDFSGNELTYDGFASGNGAALTINAQRLVVTNTAANINGNASVVFNVVTGRKYDCSVTLNKGASGDSPTYFYVGNSVFVGNLVALSNNSVTPATLTASFIADSPTITVTLICGDVALSSGYFSFIKITQANSAYTLDTFPARLAPKSNAVGGSNISFSGNEWGFVHRIEKIWQLTTDRFHDDDYALWEEFLESVSVSEVFNIDIKGTSSVPVASVTCVLADKGWSIDRIASGPYWRASFNVRLL